MHKHGSKHVILRPAIVPLLDERVTQARIERGVAWLADNWQGVEPMLRAIVHAASTEIRGGRLPESEAEAAMLSTAISAISDLKARDT